MRLPSPESGLEAAVQQLQETTGWAQQLLEQEEWTNFGLSGLQALLAQDYKAVIARMPKRKQDRHLAPVLQRARTAYLNVLTQIEEQTAYEEDPFRQLQDSAVEGRDEQQLSDYLQSYITRITHEGPAYETRTDITRTLGLIDELCDWVRHLKAVNDRDYTTFELHMEHAENFLHIMITLQGRCAEWVQLNAILKEEVGAQATALKEAYAILDSLITAQKNRIAYRKVQKLNGGLRKPRKPRR